MDYSVVPELNIPKPIERVTSEEMEHQQYLSSYNDDVKDVRDYGYGTPANHNPEEWNDLASKPRWCHQCNGINIEDRCRELHPYSLTLEASPQPVGANFVNMTTTATSTYVDKDTGLYCQK